MSCAAFTLIGAWVLAFKKSETWALWATFGAAVVMVLIAGFLAWSDEHSRTQKLEARIQEIEADVPDLHGSIDGVIVGQTQAAGGGLVAMLLMTVSIKNLKAPSIVQGYTCSARDQNGNIHEGEAQTIPAEIKTKGQGWDQKYNGLLSNLAPLYDKTAETPIERGGMRRGVLYFTFPGVVERFAPGSIFTLTFEDITEKKSTATMTLKASAGAPLYYPGAHKPK